MNREQRWKDDQIVMNTVEVKGKCTIPSLAVRRVYKSHMGRQGKWWNRWLDKTILTGLFSLSMIAGADLKSGACKWVEVDVGGVLVVNHQCTVVVNQPNPRDKQITGVTWGVAPSHVQQMSNVPGKLDPKSKDQFSISTSGVVLQVMINGKWYKTDEFVVVVR